MGKSGIQKNSTTVEEQTQQYLDSLAAKNKFFAATLGMGWRLAITVLIPLLAGIKLDQKFATTPSYTLAGFMLAVAGGAAVVWSSVKEVNAAQAEEDAERKRTASEQNQPAKKKSRTKGDAA